MQNKFIFDRINMIKRINNYLVFPVILSGIFFNMLNYCNLQRIVT